MDRGVVACIPVWNIHRDPEHWPQPEKFIPERLDRGRKQRVNNLNNQFKQTFFFA